MKGLEAQKSKNKKVDSNFRLPFGATVRGDDQVPSIVVITDEDLRIGVSNFRLVAGGLGFALSKAFNGFCLRRALSGFRGSYRTRVVEDTTSLGASSLGC